MFPPALPLTLPSLHLSSPFTRCSLKNHIPRTTPGKFLICFSPYSSSPSPIPSSLIHPRNSNPEEEKILRYVSDAAERTTTTLPCTRTFENDLVRLSLIGSVPFDQAITASAADGGLSAGEHIRANVPCMVMETVLPFPSHHHATVSTRLFVPANRVLEKGEKLKQLLTNELLFSPSSLNIFATTFRQVVMRKLWSFELTLFPAGTVRNMDDLETPRNPEESFIIRSSDDHAITMLAETVCAASLRSTEREFPSSSFNFQKQDKIVSSDSSITIEESNEDGTSIYRVTFNGDKNTKFVGWKMIGGDQFEMALSNKQMAGLSDVLDMFYEDSYTLPGKDSLPANLCTPIKYPHSLGVSATKFFAIGTFFVCLSFLSFLRFSYLRTSFQGFFNTASEVEDVANRVGEIGDNLEK